MENVKKLLDAVKQNAGIESDYALAKFLDVRTQRISDYYKGNRVPDNFVCLKIAEVLEKPLAEVIAAVELDAEKDEKRVSAWEKYYKRVGGMAAAIFLAVLLNVTFIVTPDAAEAPALLKETRAEFVLC